jgi:4'-phosphopantetheinyl transferase
VRVSVSHSGDWVLVAACRDGPVGVDVELVDARLDVALLAPRALTPDEREILATMPDEARRAGFVRYWCRKESVLKSTGDGLRSELTGLRVTGPHEPAALRSWVNQPDLVGRMRLRDLPIDERHLACVAYDSPIVVRVEDMSAAELFS